MKNNTSAIIGWIVAAVAVAGLIWYSTANYVPSATTTSTATPTTTVTTSTYGNNAQVRQSGLPKVVTSSTVSATDTTAVLTGTVVPNGAFTSYWYEYGVSPNLGYKTTSQSIGSGYTAIPAPIYLTGLSKNTSYYFYLVAENQHGKVSGAQYSFRTTNLGNLPFTGGIPVVRTLAANNISRTGATLLGEVSPNSAATQYWFEYGETASLGNITAFASVSENESRVTVSVALADLQPAKTYYFRLNAQNKFGTVNGSILNFKTTGSLAATAPTAITNNADNITKSTAVLRGVVNPNGAESSYWFEYGTDSLLGSVFVNTTDRVSVGSGVNQVLARADISNLDPNTTYYFRIVARNDLGTTRGSTLSFKTRVN